MGYLDKTDVELYAILADCKASVLRMKPLVGIAIYYAKQPVEGHSKSIKSFLEAWYTAVVAKDLVRKELVKRGKIGVEEEERYRQTPEEIEEALKFLRELWRVQDGRE